MYSPDELDNLRAEANEDGADDEDFWADVPFAKQDAYTNRWTVFTAPFTPAHWDGKRQTFATEAEALDAIRKQGEKV